MSLFKKVSEHIAQNPHDFMKVIDACRDGFEQYLKIQETKRDCIARNAISCLMASTPKKSHQTIPFMIDAAFHQFPNGPKDHCSSEIKWWAIFIKLASKGDYEENWLRQFKGDEYVIWWNKFVVPNLG